MKILRPGRFPEASAADGILSGVDICRIEFRQ